jgi:hypothetical protein
MLLKIVDANIEGLPSKGSAGFIPNVLLVGIYTRAIRKLTSSDLLTKKQ